MTFFVEFCRTRRGRQYFSPAARATTFFTCGAGDNIFTCGAGDNIFTCGAGDNIFHLRREAAERGLSGFEGEACKY